MTSLTLSGPGPAESRLILLLSFLLPSGEEDSSSFRFVPPWFGVTLAERERERSRVPADWKKTGAPRRTTLAGFIGGVEGADESPWGDELMGGGLEAAASFPVGDLRARSEGKVLAVLENRSAIGVGVLGGRIEAAGRSLDLDGDSFSLTLLSKSMRSSVLSVEGNASSGLISSKVGSGDSGSSIATSTRGGGISTQDDDSVSMLGGLESLPDAADNSRVRLGFLGSRGAFRFEDCEVEEIDI